MKNHHEELRWQKDDEIKLKDERDKIMPCDDSDEGSDEMAEETLNSEKEKMKNTWN